MTHGIGIIGLGTVGRRTLGQMAAHGGFEVVTAYDPMPAALEWLRRSHPRIRAAASPEDLVVDPRVECVYVASPPKSHLAHAALAFDRGKAVFCEKPLSVDIEAARSIAARVECERLRAAINFPYASAPGLRALQDLLAAGGLGPILRLDMTVAFREWPQDWQRTARWLGEREQGGFVREVLCHLVFLTQRVLGPLEIDTVRIDFPGDGRGAETAIEAGLRVGAIPVRVRGLVGSPEPEIHLWEITGARGACRARDWYEFERRDDGAWRELEAAPGAIRERTYMAQLDSLALMLAGGEHPLAGFREGLAVQELIEALLGRGAGARG